MLSKKQLAILFLVCLIAYNAYFFKPFAIGYDSYYYLQSDVLKGEPIGSFIVFSALKGNILAAKVLLFACLYASSISIALLGELIVDKEG